MAYDPETSIYFFKPSLPAAILFTILYIFPFLYHLYLTVIAPRRGKQERAGYFIPLLIGTGLEIAGYAVRCASVEQPANIPLYAISQSLIVIAPVFICASLYLVISRLIRRDAGATETGKPRRFMGISPRLLARIFITSDVFSFLTQCSGSGIASSNGWEGSQKDVGIGVMIGGLALQVVTFTFFLVVVVHFHRRLLLMGVVNDPGVFTVIKGIYIGGCLILVRHHHNIRIRTHSSSY